MRLLIAVLTIAAAVWLIGKPWDVSQYTEEQSPKSKFLFAIANSAISESSGVAAGIRNKEIYWTHNDSGGKADVFAFDANGRDMGSFTLGAVEARDIEDMASMRVDGVPYLYLGDIGDNLSNQKSVRIHRLAEPDVKASKKVVQVETYTVSYPDGPHNAEALMVCPAGDIYIVTKDDAGNSGIYRLQKPKRAGRYELKKIGSIKMEGGNVYSRQVTGGDVSADGKSVVLRTYFSVHLFSVDRVDEFYKKKPVSLPVPFERQGEAICFDTRNRRLITTSEGSPCRVSSISLP
jgi:hypothetical protein